MIGKWHVRCAVAECEKFEYKSDDVRMLDLNSLFPNETLLQPLENKLVFYQTPDSRILAVPFTRQDLKFEKITFPLNENLVHKIVSGTDENMKLAQKINLLTSYVRKMKRTRNNRIRDLYKKKIIEEFGFNMEIDKHNNDGNWENLEERLKSNVMQFEQRKSKEFGEK